MPRLHFLLPKIISFSLVIILSFGFLSDSMAQTPEELIKLLIGNNSQFWVGEITIKRIGNENQNDSGSGITFTQSRTVSESIVIKACGFGGSMNVTGVQRTLNDKFLKNVTAKGEGGSIRCEPRELGGSSYEGPGAYTIEQGSRTLNLYDGEKAPPLKEASSVNLTNLPGNRYVLSVASAALVTETSKSYREERAGCTGKIKKTTNQVIPGHYGDTGKIEKTGDSNEDSGSIITTTLPPFMHTLGFMKEFQIKQNQDTFTDSMVVEETKGREPGQYHEKVTASWRFRDKDQCPFVYDYLLRDLAYAEAYVDRTLQDSTKSNDKYREAVDKKTRDIYRGESGEPGEDDPEAWNDVETDGNCETHGLTPYCQDRIDECLPDVMCKAQTKHEGVHVKQCRDFHEQYAYGGPPIYGLIEVNGYLAGIKVYLSWLDTNCPDYYVEIAKVRQRIAEINRIKFERYKGGRIPDFKK